ncbi:uncharacterized protein LOC144128569 [Amblyomma americanum]
MAAAVVGVFCLLLASPGSAWDLHVSTQDISIPLGSEGGFFIYLDQSPNESLWAQASVLEGDRVVSLHGPRRLPVNGTEHTWVNVSAIGAGHATVQMNTSLPFVRTSDAFVHVEVFKVAWLETLSDVVGWIYFVAWSISFYPQIYLNWKLKCVEGLSFDFVGLNLTGFLAYSFFNLGVFFSPVVQAEYRALHPTGVIPVELNDIVFGLHAALATFITAVQCCIYEHRDQRVSLPARLLLGFVWAGAAIFGVVTLAAGRHWSSPWLIYLYYFSYCKLVITLTKYMPQAYLNFKRKSTSGWSIGNILLDFTGGTLSFVQMCLIAYNYNDWTSLFGNVVKTGLSFISMAFDVLFIVQHYVLYRHSTMEVLGDQEA